MAKYPRYAIYYAAPAESELARFGADLIGYDAFTGEDLGFPDGVAEHLPDWRDLTQDPRKYGFHATLKAPMALADGKTEAELIAACAAFADKPRTVPTITPVVNSISGFIAVIAAERSAELERLAADCVRAFDGFRPPLTPEDRQRRNPLGLTPRQREYLDRWGYPYVMEEFRFHMTLTGRLNDERRDPVLLMLRDRFAIIDLNRLAIDAIALFRQNDAHSRFRVLDYWNLRALP